MSVVTKAIGFAKKVKHRYQDQIKARTPVYLSPVRRIERVALPQRICAMTFDDGPCRLPANPSADGLPLTLHLAQTLERYGALGTFDVVGDTSGNYPDEAGKEGTASWGGVRFDHYPDFGKDADGGARNCPELMRRLLDGGHEITSHTYAHILFGRKALVYGGRKPLDGLDAVTEDLEKLDSLMKSEYGYDIRLSRPPHYVDKTEDGFSSYDAYARMGYQYLAASYDGAGWLPLATYEAEVEAMWQPMKRELEQDPSYFSGQIIFQKDGYNMARRSPITDALSIQLELLQKNGYRVVTVSQLLELCPFADLAPQDPVFPAAKALLDAGWCVCYRDNTVRADEALKRGELAMLAYGCQTFESRIRLVREKGSVCGDVPCTHPYAAAIAEAASHEMPLENGRFRPDDPCTAEEFSAFCTKRFGRAPAQTEPLTHGAAIVALAGLI